MTDDPAMTCTPHPPPAADGSPRSFDPAWRTETVLALAKDIEVERAFDRLPILADALEEAGCDDEVLLRHCRACDLHSSECWVLQQVLYPARDWGEPINRSMFGGLPRYSGPSRPHRVSGRKASLSVMDCVLISGVIFTAVLFITTILHGIAHSASSPTTKPHRVSDK